MPTRAPTKPKTIAGKKRKEKSGTMPLCDPEKREAEYTRLSFLH
jgi:hypothetical protein